MYELVDCEYAPMLLPSAWAEQEIAWSAPHTISTNLYHRLLQIFPYNTDYKRTANPTCFTIRLRN
jgi:hypothetical protein